MRFPQTESGDHGPRTNGGLATDQGLDRRLKAETTAAFYRTENGVALIELRLSNIAQLFNSFDPSPFHEKDLDHDAEEYIFTAVRELGPKTVFRIVIHLPLSEMQRAKRVKEGIQNYFSYRLEVNRRDMRYELKLGRIGLLIGLAFLFACITAREVVQKVGEGTLVTIVSEGLLISGWVAMWRPIQTFLYDWWPHRRTCAVLARLSVAEVELRPERV